MKYNLPSFSVTSPTRERANYGFFPRLLSRLVSAGVAVAVVAGTSDPVAVSAQQPPKRSGYGTSRVASRPENKEVTPASQGRGGEGGEPLPSPLTAEERDGNKLVALAAKDVFRQKAIQAKIRQQVFAFGQEVVGAGEYYQFGSGQPKLLRLDMKMQVGPQAATLLEICGRQDYWIRRHFPPAGPKLEHVNLSRLANALSRLNDDGKHFSSDHWILLGGLSRLLESLHRNFDFSPPQEAQIDDISVLVVQGRLKPERFKAMQGAVTSDGDSANTQIPTAINLTLGRSDHLLPHFPHRIEYLRLLTPKELKAAADKKNPRVTETPLSILDFYEVQVPLELKPDLFDFSPGDEDSEDKTQAWLKKLQE